MSLPRVTVVIPSYNNQKYVVKNLTSVKGQTYPHFHILYIDDASTDSTLAIAQKELRGGQGEIIANRERVYAMANLYHTISQLDKDEIVMIVDGDDWLARSDAIERVVKCYTEKGAWLTFGRYVKYPTFELGPYRNCYTDLNIRQEPWFLSHLKTFRAELFQKISKSDLMINGEFVKSAVDVAMMWPMYEMAAGRVHQMEEVVYVYNFENANAVAASRPYEQQRVAKYLQQLKPYDQLTL